MKKIVLGIMIFLIGILVGIFGTHLFYQNKINEEKEKTETITNKILELIEDKNIDIEELKEKYKEELSELKDKAKNKLEEQEIWQKVKEKLRQSLLS